MHGTICGSTLLLPTRYSVNVVSLRQTSSLSSETSVSTGALNAESSNLANNCPQVLHTYIYLWQMQTIGAFNRSIPFRHAINMDHARTG